MQVNHALLYRYWNAEYRAFMNNVLDILSEPLSHTLMIAPPRLALQKETDHIKKALFANAANPITSELAALDERRDRAILGIRTTVENLHMNHYEEPVRMAAAMLAHDLARYGTRIDKQRYQVETGTLEAIIKTWEGELAAEVATCQLVGWLEEMKTANMFFNTKYLERVRHTGADERQWAGHLRPEVDAAYKQLMLSLNARAHIARLENSPLVAEYHTAIASLNALIAEYNTAAGGGSI